MSQLIMVFYPSHLFNPKLTWTKKDYQRFRCLWFLTILALPPTQKKTSKFVRLFKQGENTHTHFFLAILSESHFFMLSIPTATHTHTKFTATLLGQMKVHRLYLKHSQRWNSWNRVLYSLQWHFWCPSKTYDMVWLCDMFEFWFGSINKFTIPLQGSSVHSPKVFDFDFHGGPISGFPIKA